MTKAKDNEIVVTVHPTPAKTGEEIKLKIRILNSIGFVTDVHVLFNRYGEKPGGEKQVALQYNESKSTDYFSIFDGTTKFESPGYRTFVVRLKVNSIEKYIKYNPSINQAVLTEETDNLNFWEIFVYLSTFETPNNIKGGIMYQIFVDTFKCKNPSEEVIKKIVEWNVHPKWEPDDDGKYRNDQFYGGNIKGIIEELPYIKSLGVSSIYLTPIFKSPSSNRYDITDYEEIDEMVGTWDELKKLHELANQMGMALIIDVVFNHSSDTNELIMREPDIYDWYHKYSVPKTWWGFKHLIEFNKENPRYNEYLAKWLKKYEKYVDGIRIDVADSLPDYTLKYIRNTFEKEKYILGEVWKNAVTGDYRGFLYGNELDGVMNYQFANSIYRYVRWGNYIDFKNNIERIYNLYPHQALAVSPIFLSSHDIPRIPNIVVGDFMKEDTNYENVWNMEQDNYWFDGNRFNTYRFREWQYTHPILKEKRELANNLHKLAVFIQYTLPGLPVIFAGDEVGVEGYKDPFNRKTFPWDNIDKEKYEFYCTLGKFRNQYKEYFADNDNFEFEHVDNKIAIYRRGNMQVVVNRTGKSQKAKNIDFSKIVFNLSNVYNETNEIPPYGGLVIVN